MDQQQVGQKMAVLNFLPTQQYSFRNFKINIFSLHLRFRWVQTQISGYVCVMGSVRNGPAMEGPVNDLTDVQKRVASERLTLRPEKL